MLTPSCQHLLILKLTSLSHQPAAFHRAGFESLGLNNGFAFVRDIIAFLDENNVPAKVAFIGYDFTTGFHL